MRIIFLIIPIFGLLFSICIQILANIRTLPDRSAEVVALFDRTFEDLKKEDLPIAGSDFMIQNVEEILDFSAYRYISLAGELEGMDIFMLYWEPRKISFLETSTHVPENCFIANGMTLIDRAKFDLDGLSAEGRVATFKHGSNPTAITSYFWHRVGDQFIDYSAYDGGKTWPFVFDNIFKGLGGSNEQLYFRVTSTKATNHEELINTLKGHIGSLLDSI